MRCMTLRIVSYNLRKLAASGELLGIAEAYDIDVLCRGVERGIEELLTAAAAEAA